jgi:hypothetical protein
MKIKTLLGISAVCVAQAVAGADYVVPSVTGGVGINTDPLVAGATYLLEASGTYIFDNSQGRTADAEFLQEVANGPFVEQRTGQPVDVLDLVINGASVDWLGFDGSNWAPHTYSPDHVYRYYVTGTGNPLNLTLADWEPLRPELHEEDNVGSLNVTITTVPDSTSTLWILPATALLFAIARRHKLAAV